MKAAGTLEDQSLWFRYKSEVWNRPEDAASVTIHNIARTLRALYGGPGLAYASVPITSGLRLFELRMRYWQADVAQLTDTAIADNYFDGLGFVERLTRRLSLPALYPADLVPAHQSWEQTHFQALWLSIIAERCTEVHMAPDWQFSNGGCEELTHVFQLRLGLPAARDGLLFFNTKGDEEQERERMRNIALFDHLGAQLTLDRSVVLMKAALGRIQGWGFEAPRIGNCIRLLEQTRDLLAEGFYQ